MLAQPLLDGLHRSRVIGRRRLCKIEEGCDVDKVGYEPVLAAALDPENGPVHLQVCISVLDHQLRLPHAAQTTHGHR